MLSTFVDPGLEYLKLILVLREIKENTLGNSFQAVVIYGGHNTGKSTLAEIIKELAPSCCYAPVTFFDNYKYGPSFDMMCKYIMKDVIIVNTEGNEDKIQEFYEAMHIDIDREICAAWGTKKMKYKPGLPIFVASKKQELSSKDGKGVLHLHLSNTFKSDPKLPREKIVQMCLEELDPSKVKIEPTHHDVRYWSQHRQKYMNHPVWTTYDK